MTYAMTTHVLSHRNCCLKCNFFVIFIAIVFEILLAHAKYPNKKIYTDDYS